MKIRRRRERKNKRPPKNHSNVACDRGRIFSKPPRFNLAMNCEAKITHGAGLIRHADNKNNTPKHTSYKRSIERAGINGIKGLILMPLANGTNPATGSWVRGRSCHIGFMICLFVCLSVESPQ